MTRKQAGVLVAVLVVGAKLATLLIVDEFRYSSAWDRERAAAAERQVAAMAASRKLAEKEANPGRTGPPSETPTAEFTWSNGPGPVSPTRSGDRYFYIDEQGQIRFTTSPAAPTGTAGTPIGG